MLSKTSQPETDAAIDPAEENSERRMRQALDALGTAHPPPAHPPPADQPAGSEGTLFALRRPREGFRADAPQPHHPQAGPHGGHLKQGRHRFVRDGEVPVVHMNAPRPAAQPAAAGRTDADWQRLHQALEDARTRADAAERARDTAQLHFKTAQTQLGHIDLARQESQKLAESRAEEILTLQDEVRRLRAELATRAQPAEKPISPTPPPARPAHQPPEPALPKRRGRPPRAAAPPPDEDKPVEWWLLPARGRRR